MVGKRKGGTSERTRDELGKGSAGEGHRKQEVCRGKTKGKRWVEETHKTIRGQYEHRASVISGGQGYIR